MNRKSIIPALAVLTVLTSVMFQNSCANTTQAPSGGKKDTIPPVIVNIKPLPGAVNVPTHNATIRFFFDEYLTVKNPKNIFLSPPMKKAPKYKLKGKSLVVYFDSDLDSNTTYTLDITDAIADNREGNMYPGYTMVFSTGPAIDSMVVTGTVRDCNTLQPINGATVMLYKDLSDSALFKSTPAAAAKTDKWGFFSIRNIADTNYRLYAIVDEMGNNVYDAESDKIAFIDTVIRPVMVASDDLPELLKYDMLDTVHCMARKSEYELYMFRDELSKQAVKNRERTGDRTAYVSFMAADAQIDSLWIRNIPQDRLIMEFNPTRDSLLIWVNDRRRPQDTLHLFVDYLKTDTTGALSPVTEHFRLPRPGGKYRRPSLSSLKHEDTICKYKLIAESSTIERKGFRLTFDFPIITEGFGKMTLTSTNPRQQKSDVKFTVENDSTDLRSYKIKIAEKMMPGYEYALKLPHRVFRDINGFYNDSTECKVSLPKDDKLSQIQFNMTNVSSRYIIDLLGEKMDKVLDTYTINADESIVFPYLRAGKYCVRLTQDKNNNGRVDTGNLMEHRQPEKVKFYTLKDGSYVFNLPEGTEMEQNLDVAKLFEK
ncbi:MAG: Ig-like domain-containing protein [Bacteroidales bacterium]|nr:Ig-like domain-containing protein [Bacteroidales bacterium]